MDADCHDTTSKLREKWSDKTLFLNLFIDLFIYLFYDENEIKRQLKNWVISFYFHRWIDNWIRIQYKHESI